VHCASLGEFEQGRPVIEAIMDSQPGAAVILTFFSPSGYLIRKDYPMASQVEYLPLDSPLHARRFVEEFAPQLALFIKYEFWYHYLDALRRRGIPYVFISAVFRPSQVFFRSWGGWFRNRLASASGIFVQDQASLDLLHAWGIDRAVLSGDTRYDRVSQVSAQARELEGISGFIRERACLVAGSTWPEDEKALRAVLGAADEGLCLIIAPHEVDESRIRSLMASLSPSAVRYSSLNESRGDARVLVIDNVGMLASLYRYADLCWVGGGFGSGLHNILEPAAHGKPVLFGPVHQKFPEAAALIAAGGGFSISGGPAAVQVILGMLARPSEVRKAGEISREFVQKRRGACDIIMEGIHALKIGKDNPLPNL